MPIEVVPFAYAKVLRHLRNELGSPNAALRMAVAKGRLLSICHSFDLSLADSFFVARCFKAGPVVSDNGNFIIDAPFDREKMKDPQKVIMDWTASLKGVC